MSDPRKKAWIRTRLTRDGIQLWRHARTAEIKHAIDTGMPVHWLDDDTIISDLSKPHKFGRA